MEIIIRGNKVAVTDSMKEYIEEKLSKLDKYLKDSDNARATVVIKIRGHKQVVEVTIPLKSLILRSEEEQEDAYAAIDVAIDKLERQIRKNKTKLMSRQSKTNVETYDFSIDDFDDIDEEETEVLKRKSISVKPMSEEEAVLQLDLLGHQFYMYKDSETMKPAVVYKRKDGGYGIIESE